ncbi:MAG: hypothetical protein ABIZ64_01780 [Casimicrobium sp.]|jgi:hypothetical protein
MPSQAHRGAINRKLDAVTEFSAVPAYNPEERSADQFRGQSHHRCQQIADYKTRIDGVEKALLAERVGVRTARKAQSLPRRYHF